MQSQRRDFLVGLAGIAGAWEGRLGVSKDARAGRPAARQNEGKSSVRDKFWIWGWKAGALNNQFGLPASRMTPAEGAFYLGVPNLILVGQADPKVPCGWAPETSAFDAYAISFRPLKRVVWLIGRSYLEMKPEDLEVARQLAQKFPNIVGVVMDDFFRFTVDGGEVGNRTPEELAYIQKQLQVEGRKLDLWTTLYSHDMKYNISAYVRHVDVASYWTWDAKDLEKLASEFEELEKATPGLRKVLGCYMWDYGTYSPMPVAMMQKQCELGLKWLEERRIEGIIFLGSGSCDLQLKAVEWTRNWISEVGDEFL